MAGRGLILCWFIYAGEICETLFLAGWIFRWGCDTNTVLDGDTLQSKTLSISMLQGKANQFYFIAIVHLQKYNIQILPINLAKYLHIGSLTVEIRVCTTRINGLIHRFLDLDESSFCCGSFRSYVCLMSFHADFIAQRWFRRNQHQFLFIYTARPPVHSVIVLLTAPLRAVVPASPS